MKPESGKSSSPAGEFIARIYDVYFPNSLVHHGGTDPDHVPVIPVNDLPPDTRYLDDSSLQSTTLSDQEISSELELRPETTMLAVKNGPLKCCSWLSTLMSSALSRRRSDLLILSTREVPDVNG